MIAYQTDFDGVFVAEVECFLSPLDDDGTYLIPAGAVTKAPPAFGPGQQARWNGKKWIIEQIPGVEVESIPQDELIVPEIVDPVIPESATTFPDE